MAVPCEMGDTRLKEQLEMEVIDAARKAWSTIERARTGYVLGHAR